MKTIRVPTLLYCLIVVAGFCTIWDAVSPYFVTYEIGQVVHYKGEGQIVDVDGDEYIVRTTTWNGSLLSSFNKWELTP